MLAGPIYTNSAIRALVRKSGRNTGTDRRDGQWASGMGAPGRGAPACLPDQAPRAGRPTASPPPHLAAAPPRRLSAATPKTSSADADFGPGGHAGGLGGNEAVSCCRRHPAAGLQQADAATNRAAAAALHDASRTPVMRAHAAGQQQIAFRAAFARRLIETFAANSDRFRMPTTPRTFGSGSA